MNDLVQDTWHELREKRLWPVALLLVAAIVAIPLVLSKSAAAPPPPAPTAAATPPAEQTAVTLDGGDAASTGTGSSLERFAEDDPFTPPGAIARAGQATTDRAMIASSSADSKSGAGGGQGDGGTSPGTAPDEPTRFAPPQTRTETAEFEYVADVTFWAGDRRRVMRGLRKLDMLPNQAAPVLIFMGTAGNGGNAVFLVDSTLKAAGEGRCVPSQANCAYVHLGAGAEHAFSTQEGDSYRLRVDEIRRVKVGAAAARRPTASSSGATRRFELPSLVDLVAVTETTTGRSSVPADGR